MDPVRVAALYDIHGNIPAPRAALAEMRAAGLPDIDELMLRESLLEPTDSDRVARYFEDLAR